MGKKYIIELEDNECVYKTIIKKDPMIQAFELLSPTPYTELDLERVRKEGYVKGLSDVWKCVDEINSKQEQVKKEEYEKGLSDGKNQDAKDFADMYDSGYSEGLKDAWEAARKIGSNSMCSLKEMGFDFTRCIVPDYNPSWFVVKNYSAQEAIEEIRAYEQAQKEKEEKEEKDSVTTEEVMRRYLDKFCKRNFCTKCLLHTPDFTCGRGYHFLTNHPVSDEEVRRAYAKVVQKMRE